MKITIAMLEKMPDGSRACDDAHEWFSLQFPDGADLEAAWQECQNPLWKIWFACHALPADDRQALAFRFAGQAFRFAAQRHSQLSEFADNVTTGNWQVAAAAGAADAADAADAARAEQVEWCHVALMMKE